MWIQTDASLAEWEDRVEDVQSLMIGDVEYEVRAGEIKERVLLTQGSLFCGGTGLKA